MDKTLVIGCGIVGGLAAPVIAKTIHQSSYGPLVETIAAYCGVMAALASTVPNGPPMKLLEYWRNFS